MILNKNVKFNFDKIILNNIMKKAENYYVINLIIDNISNNCCINFSYNNVQIELESDNIINGGNIWN